MPLKHKNSVVPTLYDPSKHIQPCKNTVFRQPVSCRAPNLHKENVIGAKSLRALLAVLKVKTKKVQLL